jgi:hypothetical protein
MSQRITTQTQMRAARTVIDFCYICGEPLPARGAPKRTQVVMGEDVIPKAFLAQRPQREQDHWCIKLNVHRECEAQWKQHEDHWLKNLQCIHTESLHHWPESGHLRDMPIEPGLHIDSHGRRRPAFAGLRPLLDGVWLWVRGLHAALYGEYLATETRNHVLPLVPAASSEGGFMLEEVEALSHMIRCALGLATRHERWDGITCWGGAVSYRCVWWHAGEQGSMPRWICFWSLSIPRSDEWSRSVLGAGHERPRHGHYYRQDAAEGASILESRDLPSHPEHSSTAG